MTEFNVSNLIAPNMIQEVTDFELSKEPDILYCIDTKGIMKYVGTYIETKITKNYDRFGEVVSDRILIFEKDDFNESFNRETGSKTLYKIIKPFDKNHDVIKKLKEHQIWYLGEYRVGQYLVYKNGIFDDESTARISINYDGNHIDIPGEAVALLYGIDISKLKEYFTTPLVKVEGGKRKNKKTQNNRKVKKIKRKLKSTKKQRK
jgi:hypothetical protein